MRNRYRIKLYTLTNIKANGFVFINTTCVIDVAKFLNIKATRLKKPITVKGFNNKRGHTVSYIFTLYFFINKR